MVGDHNAVSESEKITMLTKKGHLKNLFVDTIDPRVLSHPVNAPTRRLDYILVNENMKREIINGGAKVMQSFEPDTMRIISDHLPLSAVLVKKER